MSRARRIAIVVTPLVAMATLAMGLRVGARSAVHGAIVYGAPRAKESTTFAWQIVTVLEDRGVREAMRVRDLTVRARTRDGEALWRGDSNGDGVAEVTLTMPWAHEGDAMDLEVTAPGEPPLARGSIAWGHEPWLASHGPHHVRPTRRAGDVALDVAILGGALVPGFFTPFWVRASDPAAGGPLAGVAIDAEPEPGLALDRTSATTCEEGWAAFRANPQIHVIGLSLHARSREGREGDWVGAPTVAPGASFAGLPLAIEAGVARAIDVLAPNARQVAYVEVDDEAGRAYAVALSLAPDDHGMPHARAELPPLGEGLHWLVISGEPRGGESITGATIARPFWVGASRDLPTPQAEGCKLGPRLANESVQGFARFVALDGFVGRQDANAVNRARGMALALGSIAVAALLELLLILQGARETRLDLARAASAMGEEAAASLSRRTSAGSVIVGILVALLGFGLLASMLLWRAT